MKRRICLGLKLIKLLGQPPQTRHIRNHNLEQIIEHGRMHWQKLTQYGRRNYSELAIQRYKRILGNRLHSRELSRQKQEAMIGSSVLNKMTSLGMPISYRYA
jgi:hypothetical protein